MSPTEQALEGCPASFLNSPNISSAVSLFGLAVAAVMAWFSAHEVFTLAKLAMEMIMKAHVDFLRVVMLAGP